VTGGGEQTISRGPCLVPGPNYVRGPYLEAGTKLIPGVCVWCWGHSGYVRGLYLEVETRLYLGVMSCGRTRLLPGSVSGEREPGYIRGPCLVVGTRLCQGSVVWDQTISRGPCLVMGTRLYPGVRAWWAGTRLCQGSVFGGRGHTIYPEVRACPDL
jgi:hypothetical protein